MLQRMKINHPWNLHCSIDGKSKENEESNQMPAMHNKITGEKSNSRKKLNLNQE